MKLFLISAAGAALLLAGCDSERSVRIESRSDTTGDSGVMRVINTLQCPQTQGDLTLRAARAGGSVCTYAGPRGSEVEIHLVTLDSGSPDAALARFEASLNRDLPRAASPAAAAAPEPPAAPEAPEPAAAPASGERVDVRAPGLDVSAEGEKASVRLPGINIQADGDRANVNIGPIHIRADDSAGTVNISDGEGGEMVSVQGDDTGARVRTRAPGEAIRATFLISDSESGRTGGWRTVGYVARGPSGGPMVVAVFRTKESDADPVRGDADELVSINVGD